MRSSILLLLAVLALATSTAAQAANDNNHRDGYFHTMEMPADIDEEVAAQVDDGHVEYEPVTIFDGRLALPEWAVAAYESLTGRTVPRTPMPPPHDAPVSPRAFLHLPRHLGKNKDKRSGSSPNGKETVEGEWLVMVRKSHRDDFVGVLEDMGDHLNKRFGLTEWFDLGALRASKRAHAERQLRRRAAGEAEERPWTVSTQTDDNAHQALEFDKRMLVRVTVPAPLRHRQDEIVDSLLDKEWTEFIEPNMVMRTAALTQTLSPTSTAYPYPWGIDRIDQRDLPLNDEYVYESPTSNVAVYIVDTGIRTTHTEFGGRASWGTNAVGDGINSDCYGHGTHVAGTAVGTNVGVAKDVDVVAVKVLGCDGTGTSGTVITGINWVINNCPSGTKCIISLSLGGSDASLSIDSIVQSAYNAGMVVVSAAGNSNIDACNVSPARSPYGITVGASTQSDGKAFFSNYGSCVDIWAPGMYIPSSYNNSNTNYATLSGTSQATPHVTGAVALYLGAVKSCTPSEAAGAVYASATLNRLTGTGSGSPNRLLYSRVDRGVVPQTAAAACTGNACTSTSGNLTSSQTWTVSITVDAATAQYGYLQAWLEATADFDLTLQFYSAGTYKTVASSSGGSGSEWIQFATSALGGGTYRFVVTATVGANGSFSLYYQAPSSAQAGTPQTAAAASVVAPFWLSLLRAF